MQSSVKLRCSHRVYRRILSTSLAAWDVECNWSTLQLRRERKSQKTTATSIYWPSSEHKAKPFHPLELSTKETILSIVPYRGGSPANCVKKIAFALNADIPDTSTNRADIFSGNWTELAAFRALAVVGWYFGTGLVTRFPIDAPIIPQSDQKTGNKCRDVILSALALLTSSSTPRAVFSPVCRIRFSRLVCASLKNN